MKRLIPLISLLLAAAALEAGEVIQNGEDALLYYATLPLRPAEIAAINDVPAAVRAYILDNSRSFEYLPPLAARELPSAPGPRLLIGFFLVPGADSAPVIAMKLPGGRERLSYAATRSYAVLKADRAPMSMPVWDLSLKPAAIQLDNRYLDWLKVPELARFASAFSPVVFARENGDKREAGRIQDSMFWRKGGTQIETVKALRDGGVLNLMLSTTSEMADGLSFFFYLNNRAFTLELPVRGAWGPVLLWKNGERKPRPAGEFVKSQFYLEARLDLAALPAEAGPAGAGGIDLASCFFGGGAVEEFLFTTVYARDIPDRP